MRDTFARERAKRAPGGTEASDATRDATGRFVAKSETPSTTVDAVPEGKPASRPPPEAGQPSKEGEGSPDGERIPKAAFQERLARERKKQEGLSQRAEHAEMQARRAEEAFRLATARADKLEQALREGRTFDPRDAALERHELANEARAAAQRLDAEFAQRRQAAVEEQATAEAREAARVEVKAAIAKYPLAAFQEIVDAMVANPGADLDATAKRLHDAREAMGWVRKPTEPPAPVAPTLSRATSAGPAASAPVGHDRSALLATYNREEAKRKTMTGR